MITKFLARLITACAVLFTLTFSLSAAATITYSGSLSFPSGTSATSQTRTVLVVAENPANISQFEILTVPFSIGQTETNYTITLPDNGHDWRLRYSCSLCNAQGILTAGFYSSSGSVTQADDATILSGASSCLLYTSDAADE